MAFGTEETSSRADRCFLRPRFRSRMPSRRKADGPAGCGGPHDPTCRLPRTCDPGRSGRTRKSRDLNRCPGPRARRSHAAADASERGTGVPCCPHLATLILTAKSISRNNLRRHYDDGSRPRRTRRVFRFVPFRPRPSPPRSSARPSISPSAPAERAAPAELRAADERLRRLVAQQRREAGGQVRGEKPLPRWSRGRP